MSAVSDFTVGGDSGSDLIRVETPPFGVFRYLARVQLDGVFYRFYYQWNEVDQSWHLDIATDGSVALIRNIRLSLATDVLGCLRADPDFPPGILSIVNVVDGATEPTLETFGDTVQVLYRSVSGG